MKSRFNTALVFVLVTSAIMPVPRARAAIYEVHACRVPNGTTAPAHGWSPTPHAVASLDCPGGKMTVQTPAGTHSPGWRYGLTFAAPTGTSIAGFRRYVEGRIVQVDGGPPPWSWNYLEEGVVVGEEALTTLMAWSNPGPFDEDFVYPLEKRLSRLQFSIECDDYRQTPGPCQGNGSAFSLRRIAVQLDDRTAPRVLAASGSLLEGTDTQRGQRQLVLSLRDVGSGLFRIRVDVDGERLSELPIDENQGACRSPFVLPVPCKLAATVTIPVDTTRLTEGRHTILVHALDATGSNEATVGPISLVVDNVPDPPPHGTAACPTRNLAAIRRHLTHKIVRAGHPASIVGRVSAPSRTLRGARIGVVDNPSVVGRPRLAKIGRRGRYRLKLRAKQSTTIRPILVSAAGDAQACGKPVKLEMRAGVRLATSPTHLRNGESIRMRGRVSSRGIPRQGKSVAIQARARGASSWTTVTLMRSDAGGRFHFAYRFRKTFRATTYEFRAVAPRQRGYPYLRGWSRVRRATVSA